MTEPCHCDLTSENAKLRGEVERLKREATSARSAIRHAIRICRFMEPKPNLANGDCVGLPEQFWRRRLGTVDEVEPMPLTLDRLREVEARLTEEQWEAYGNALVTLLLDEHGKYKDTQLIHLSADQKIKALASVLREAANG